MLRIVLLLVGIFVLSVGLSWLADRPGTINIEWQGYTANPSVFQAIIAVAILVGVVMLAWSIIRQVWQSPATIGSFFLKRRHQRGLESLSSGMIAIGAGDRALATRYAIQARKALPNEPLTQLLRAQAAQLSGDRATARRIFDAMLSSPDTEQLGLRGLFLEAEREGETEVARQYAERALTLNPKLGWSADALFDLQCRQGDWAGALETLAVAKRHGQLEKPVADRRRAVLLTAQAQALEEGAPDQAMALATEAHGLAPDLIPAAAIAARILAARGNTQKAAKVIERTWRKAPHPELATAYAYARIGDSAKDRLTRVRHLADINQHSIESPIAVATAAIEGRDWAMARKVLTPLQDGRLTQRVCTLMAKIEGGEQGDAGRVREWLARAVNAPRDPAWTADGIVSDHWSPVSPVTGQLDAFQWKVPVESAHAIDQSAIVEKLEELVALGAGDGKPAEPQIALPIRAESTSSGERSPSPRAKAAAEDAAVVELPSPPPVASAVAAEPAAAAPQARTGAAAANGMADGVLRTVRAAPAATPMQRPKPVAATASHMPDDPGPGGDDIVESRPYRTTYAAPAKQRG